MRAPWWLRRRRTPSTVTVELVADTSRFEAAMAEAAEGLSRNRFRMRVRHERSLGQAYVGVLLDGLCHGFGLDPVQVWRVPRARDQRLAALNAPDREARRAAEAAWLAEHRAHRAAVVAEREAEAGA